MAVRTAQKVAQHSQPLLTEPSTVDSESATVFKDKATSESTREVPNVRAHSRTRQFPGWLSRPCLLSFSALFAALIASLVVLWHFSELQNGLEISLSSNHLAWTYGPTAILVVVVSLWRQVEYCYKSTQAWCLMRRGFTPASESILLDYLWPLQVKSLISSIKHSHYQVSLSIIGFTILKLVTLASTGLLISTSTEKTRLVPTKLQTTFDGTRFWQNRTTLGLSTTGQISGHNYGFYEGSYPKLSIEPLYAYIATLGDDRVITSNLTYNIAVQQLSIPSTPSLSAIEATIDAFVPDIQCEDVHLEQIPEEDTAQNYIYLSSATCPSFQGNDNKTAIQSVTQVPIDFLGYANNVSDVPLVSEISFTRYTVNCSVAPRSFPNQYFVTFFDDTTPYDFRYAMIAKTTTWKSLPDPQSNITTYRESLSNYTAVMCKVGYNIKKVNLRTSLLDRKSTVTSVDNLSQHHLPDLSSLQFSEILDSIVQTASDFDVYRPQIAGKSVDGAYPIVDAMALSLNEPQTLDRLLDATTLKNTFVQSMQGIASQFIQDSFSAPTDTEIEVTGIFVETRLHVAVFPLWFMIGGLGIMFTLTLILAVLLDPNQLLHHQSSIIRSAAILASSPNLKADLVSSGAMNMKMLRTRLSSVHCRTIFHDSFYIETKGQVAGNEDIQKDGHKIKSAWIPYQFRRHALLLLTLLPITAIVTLEIIYQLSVKRQGLIDVAHEKTSVSYIVRYASTLLCLLIATLYNNFDFTMSVMTPFTSLQARSVSHAYKEAIFINFLARSPPVALYQSLRHGFVASSLSQTASLIGSLLTIIASGLWVFESITTSHTREARLISQWDPRWENSLHQDSGAGTRFNDIEHGTTSQSSTVWENLVLPALTLNDTSDILPTPDSTGLSSALNYTYVVPALRPKLSCEVVPAENMSSTILIWNAFEGDNSVLELSTWLELSSACTSVAHSKTSLTNITTTFGGNSSILANDGWFGRFYDLHIGPPVEGPESSFTANGSRSYVFANGETVPGPGTLPDNPNGCPSIGIQFGYLSLEGEYWYHPRSLINVSALVCHQRLQQVQTTVTYIGDPTNMSLSMEHPPRPDETTAIYIDNGTEGFDTFPYRIELHLANLTSITDNKGIQPVDFVFDMKPGMTNADFDMFFNHLVLGPNGTSIESLYNKSNNHANLITAVERLYQQYMVNVIDLNFRQPVQLQTNSNEAVTYLTGTADIRTGRLKVDQSSKLVLQIMLAVMTILGIFAYSLVDLRNTLPKNPCSIASTMSLLADSQLCEHDMPENAALMSDRELKQMFGRRTFSLGWWRPEHRERQNVPRTSIENDNSDPDHDHDHEISQEGAELQPAVATLTKEAIGDESDMHFGIDVGRAERLGFVQSSSWLRSRLIRRKKRISTPG